MDEFGNVAQGFVWWCWDAGENVGVVEAFGSEVNKELGAVGHKSVGVVVLAVQSEVLELALETADGGNVVCVCAEAPFVQLPLFSDKLVPFVAQVVCWYAVVGGPGQECRGCGVLIELLRWVVGVAHVGSCQFLFGVAEQCGQVCCWNRDVPVDGWDVLVSVAVAWWHAACGRCAKCPFVVMKCGRQGGVFFVDRFVAGNVEG